jgi:hypothetical protein
MKPKHLLVLAAMAIATLGVAVVTTMERPPSQQAEIGQRLFPEIAARADDIRAIVMTHRGGQVRIVRDGDRWLVPDRRDYPAAPEKVRQLLIGLGELRAFEAKSKSPSLYPSMEVEDVEATDAKSIRVALLDSSGATIVGVIVGKERLARGGTVGDGVFVRRVGDAQAWLAQGRVAIQRDATAWLDRKIVDVARERVREVHILGGKDTLVVARAKVDDKDFTIADVPTGRKPKGSMEVNAVSGAFEGLELEDVRPAAEIAFAANGPVTQIVTFDGLRVLAAFAEHEGATWVKFTASVESTEPLPADAIRDEAAAINARAANWAYKLPSWKVETLRRKMDDLLEAKSS